MAVRVLFLLVFYGMGNLYREKLEKADTVKSVWYFAVILSIAMVLVLTGRPLIYGYSRVCAALCFSIYRNCFLAESSQDFGAGIRASSADPIFGAEYVWGDDASYDGFFPDQYPVCLCRLISRCVSGL